MKDDVLYIRYSNNKNMPAASERCGAGEPSGADGSTASNADASAAADTEKSTVATASADSPR
jgi:hypothetical protein